MRACWSGLAKSNSPLRRECIPQHHHRFTRVSPLNGSSCLLENISVPSRPVLLGRGEPLLEEIVAWEWGFSRLVRAFD
jgi:hypothetical protein